MREDRINRNEPEALEGDPVAPPHLDAVAREEFDRIVPELRALGVLSRTDQSALAIYAQTYSRWVAAEKQINDIGLLVRTGKGSVVLNPAVAIARDAMEALRRILTEFGCTPSSRSRLNVKTEGPVDELDQFLASGR